MMSIRYDVDNGGPLGMNVDNGGPLGMMSIMVVL